MELRGKIIEVMPAAQGVSKGGKEWHKQEFIIETLEQYPKKICLQIFGESKVDQFSYYRIGQEVICQVRPESREFNGNWYTTIFVWSFHGTQQNQK